MLSKRSQEFVDRVLELGKEYGLSIAHQDSQGSFIIEPFKEWDSEWLRAAIDRTVENRS